MAEFLVEASSHQRALTKIGAVEVAGRARATSRSNAKATSTPPTSDVRRALATGLRARHGEIEEAVGAKVASILGAKHVSDPEYREGLRSAVSAALDFGLSVVERGEQGAPSVPVALLAQARLAARSGLELDTVLRRYIAGYALLDDFLLQEAAKANSSGPALTPVLRSQRAALNGLIGAVSEEHARERAAQQRSDEERRAERIQRFLDGEPMDASRIPYDFQGQHLGLLASGPGAAESVQALALALDRSALTIPKPDGVMWAWLGSRDAQGWADIKQALHSSWPSETPLALGELGAGEGGWRLTHRQARAALPIALRMSGRPVRYADVALEASMSQDDLLIASLGQLYISPLAECRDGGEKIRETLRIFLDSNRMASVAAEKLGVRRQTVTYRIEAYESLIGKPLDACAEAVRTALRLEELGYTEEPTTLQFAPNAKNSTANRTNCARETPRSSERFPK